MSETSKCRRCEQTIFWHKSKAGKSYPCDSEDRKDFHQCSESSTSKAAPLSLNATTEERLAALEHTVRGLTRQINLLRTTQPITDQDAPW